MPFFMKQRPISLSGSLRLVASVSVVVLIVLGMPSLGFPKPKGPCSCKDIQDIESTLKTIDETRDAWLGVLKDILDQGNNAPKNMDEAKQSFRQKMGWTSTQKVGGLDPNTGEIVTDPQYEQEHCESIVQSNSLHESAHRSFYPWHPLEVVAGAFDPRILARLLAESEIDARDKQEKFLKDELEKLKGTCPWRCECTGKTFDSLLVCKHNCPCHMPLGHLDICHR